MHVEIRSNILGDIAKIRKGVVFKEYATVVDELLQNCQRADARNVSVELAGDVMIVEDDGIGCRDPQAVFEKNTTAWGNVDEAFGEGFFSVFLLADKLEVESCDWRLEVDVLRIFETGDLRIDVERVSDWRQGFWVKITGKRIGEYHWSLRKEAEMLGEIAPYDMRINGCLVDKKGLLDTDEEFSLKVTNSVYEAVLVPSRYFTSIQTFYENRPVKSHYAGFVGGKIHFRRGMITLKAPDRKEFIFDKKKEEFEKALKRDATRLYRSFISQASDEQIDLFADAICNFLDVDDYLHLLQIDESFFDVLRYLKDDEDRSGIEVSVEESIEVFQELFEREGVTVVSAPENGVPVEKKVPGVRLLDVVEKDKKLAWVSAGEVDALKSDIRMAEYYGFKVVVAKNQLYEKAFKHLGVLNINDLKEEVKRKDCVENEGPSTYKEERFLFLLKRIEEHYRLENVFQIADLMMESSYLFQGDEVEVEKVVVEGLCKPLVGKIYLDRTCLGLKKYRVSGDSVYKERVTMSDMRVLLRNIETISHELAHLLFLTEDNTLEHAQATSKICKEIADLY